MSNLKVALDLLRHWVMGPVYFSEEFRSDRVRDVEIADGVWAKSRDISRARLLAWPDLSGTYDVYAWTLRSVTAQIPDDGDSVSIDGFGSAETTRIDSFRTETSKIRSGVSSQELVSIFIEQGAAYTSRGARPVREKTSSTPHVLARRRQMIVLAPAAN